MIDGFQQAALNTRLHIPLLYGVDSVHGHGNLLGATVFPHNIGLGATRDPALVRDVEHIAAIETRASGPQWSFAPCICAARDDRWGRTYESFGEDPGLVDPDGDRDRRLPGRARPPRRPRPRAGHRQALRRRRRHGLRHRRRRLPRSTRASPSRTASPSGTTSLRQYVPAVQDHHVGSVMPSFSSVDWTEDGVGNPIKMHANRELITDVLKGSMGFDGFVISDWEGIHQIPGDWATQVRTGVNAGIDMMMEPFQPRASRRRSPPRCSAGRVPMAASTTPSAASSPRSSSSGSSSTRTPTAPTSTTIGSRGAPRGGPPGGRRVAGAAEEPAAHAAARARTPTSTSRAATPTTSATRPAAGR